MSLLTEARSDPYIALIERLAPPFDDWEWTIAGAAGIGLAAPHVPGVAEVGYWVLERRGEGLATRAVALIADWAFAEAGVERLQATVEGWNVASQRVLEHNGFEREGLLRGYAAYGGRRRDVLIYGRLR